MLELVYHSDAGHAWLKVAAITLAELECSIEFSNYSYVDSDHFYLEEDCDAPKFRKFLDAKGIDYTVSEIYDGDDSPIRLMQTMREAKLKAKYFLNSIDID